MSDNNKKLCIGIDVSKATLDIYWQEKFYKLENTLKAISAFIKAEIAGRNNILCVMESTGGYERVAVNSFKKAGICVHVAHPNKVHAFAKATNYFTKTDKLDAILIHSYAEFISSKETGNTVVNESYEDLIALRRLSRSLEKNLHSAQCRLKQMPKSCFKFLKAEILMYKKQIAAIQKEIDEKIADDPDLKSKRDLMVTMKGMGEKVSSTLLAELPELGTLSRRKIARLVGLAPKTYQSGIKSTKGHINGGRFFVRKAIYMSALVAARYDPNFTAKYKALQERGKPKKVALVAIMRKMIIALNAMIRDNKIFAIST